MKPYKLFLYVAVLISVVSAFNFIEDLALDFPNLVNKSYLAKQDYVELKYNRYQVYRYYDWIRCSFPEIGSYGLITSREDNSSYDRYRHRMNYFLFPSSINENDARYFSRQGSILLN